MLKTILGSLAVLALAFSEPAFACPDCKDCPHKTAAAEKAEKKDKADVPPCPCAKGKECTCPAGCECAHCKAKQADEKKGAQQT